MTLVSKGKKLILKGCKLIFIFIYMDLFFAFTETDISTKFFFSSFVGVGVSAFFIFLLFWLTNQKAMFNGSK